MLRGVMAVIAIARIYVSVKAEDTVLLLVEGVRGRQTGDLAVVVSWKLVIMKLDKVSRCD